MRLEELVGYQPLPTDLNLILFLKYLDKVRIKI